MRESEFIEKNKNDWKELAEILDNPKKSPDRIHDLFIKVSADLSYAQTHFPRRSVRWYLNYLISNVFDEIKTKKKLNFFQSISKFYTDTLPVEILRHKMSFILSFAIFALAVVIGFYSTTIDEDFPRQILGSRYVEMTENNINMQDPFGVYKTYDPEYVFLQIAVNNSFVSISTFVMGLFAGLGTLLSLLNNGVMLGAFHGYFYTKGILIDSILTIWIHGTIEISSIIVAGAAGFILGQHILFPKSYSRLNSLIIGTRRAMIIVISTIPLFISAAFLEMFVTPMDMPNAVKLFIIGVSALIMITIYVIKPILYYLNNGMPNTQVVETKSQDLLPNITKMEDQEYSHLEKSVRYFSQNIEYIFSKLILPIYALQMIILLIYCNGYVLEPGYNDGFVTSVTTGGIIWFFVLLASFCYICYGLNFLITKTKNPSERVPFSWSSIIPYLIFGLLLQGVTYVVENKFFGYSIFLFFPPMIVSHYLASSLKDDNWHVQLIKSIKFGYSKFASSLSSIAVFLFIVLLAAGISNLALQYGNVASRFLQFFKDPKVNSFFVGNMIHLFFHTLIFIFCFILFYFKYSEILNQDYSLDLRNKLSSFFERREAIKSSKF